MYYGDNERGDYVSILKFKIITSSWDTTKFKRRVKRKDEFNSCVRLFCKSTRVTDSHL
jgi:hypothetical protein